MLLIAIIGLAVALVAAMMLVRRRTDELESLRRASGDSLAALAATEATRTAAAMAQALAAVEAMLPVGVLHLDSERRIDRANDRAHALLEVRPGRLIGRSVMEAFLDPRAEVLIDGVPVGGTGSGEVKVGDREPHHLVVSIHRPDDTGRLVVLEDVTELRRLQQIRSEFIDNLSHELRTPLSTVSLLAETLARDAETSECPGADAGPDHEDRGRDGPPRPDGQRAAGPRADRGRQPARLGDDVDLGRWRRPRRSGCACSPSARASRSAVDVRRRAAAGPGRRGAPRPGVRQPRPQRGEVQPRRRRGRGRACGATARDVVVSVADHGVGIPKADRARIFERFYKVDRARVAAGGGTGLGLAIARHIVEQHGGRIWVESTEGVGSTSRSRPDRQPPPDRARRARPPRSDGGPMDRLLVATLNILNLADRWAERLPLLLADMAALQPDLIGLQEVVYPMQQDRLLGAAGEGRYEAVRGWAGRPEYGNSLLVKAPLVGDGRRAAGPRARAAPPTGRGSRCRTARRLVVRRHPPPPLPPDAARPRRAGRRRSSVARRGARRRRD